MPRPEQVDAARLLLRKASSDLAAARELAANPAQDDAIIGFHAQQTVEKAFKAVLAAGGQEVPRTHDISFLLRQLAKGSHAAPDTLREARWLTPWAVTMRYDENDDDLFAREETVGLAAAAVDWARSVVDEQAD